MNRYSMAKILALKYVAGITGVFVNMDTLRKRAICVSLDSGKIYKFKNYDEGLYYFDMAEHE